MNFSHLFTLPKRTASLSFVFSGPTKLVLDNCEGFQWFLWRRINKANGLFLPWNFSAHIYFLKISVLGVGQKKVEEVAFLPPRSGTRVCWIWRTTAIFDLRSSGIFQAGRRCRRGGNVSTPTWPNFTFRFKAQRCWNQYPSSTTRLFSAQGPDKNS